MTAPAAVAAEGSAAAPAAPAAPELSPIAAAAAEARGLLAARESAAEETPEAIAARVAAGDTAETDAELEARAAREAAIATETPEEKVTREAAEAAAAVGDAALRVEFPGTADGEESIEVEYADPESAARAQKLVAGYMRGNQAREIYDKAQELRDTAESIRYGVEADPGGFLVSVIKDQPSIDHLFNYLATRPGVLERNAAFIGGLLDKPDDIKGQEAILEAERIRRRDAVSGQIKEKATIDANARLLVREMHKAVDDLVPAEWDEARRARFYQDSLLDLRSFARANNLRTVDPKAVPKVVTDRLKTYGIEPRKSGGADSKPKVGKDGKAVVPVSTEVTAAELLKQRRARRGAGGAPAGAGSPIATLEKPPAFDPKQPGSPIQQAARYARAKLASLGKKPTT